MLEKLLSITGIKPASLKSNESPSIEKPLPQNNSIVKLDILDKIGGNYKLLVEGKLFQAKLPADINSGEVLLAKVLGQSPFTLSLDGLVSLQNITSKEISLLLSKLQISDSEKSQKVLKAFIGSKKPLEKSKLEKLIKILESEDINLDDVQLGYLLQILFSSSEGFSSLNKSLAHLFSFPVKDIISDIYNSVKELNSLAVPENIINSLNNSFIIDVDELEKSGGAKLKNYENQVTGFFDFLNRIESYGEFSPSVIQEVNKFKAAFIRYNIQKAYLNRIGISPEFIIVKDENQLNLLEYEIKKTNPGEKPGIHHIKLEMSPDQLGLVSVQGFLAGSSFQATISASEKTCTVFAYEKENIAEKLQNELNIKANLNFEVKKPGKSDAGFSPQSNTGKIDVTI